MRTAPTTASPASDKSSFRLRMAYSENQRYLALGTPDEGVERAVV
jgi:hypothetical protein